MEVALPSFDDPCVVFALSWESGPFRREFHGQQRFPGAPCPARFHGPEWLSVLVLETGIGTKAMEAALGWALSSPTMGKVPYLPKVVISAGFSGSLREGLKVGDVILATEVADVDGNRWPTTWPGDLPAGEWRPPLHRARILNTPHLVADPEEKKRLGERHDAWCVDMETAVIARLCHQHQVPFGCVRVISDDVNTFVSPALEMVLSRGRVSPLALVGSVVKSPALLGELWHLARNTRRAGGQLSRALSELLTLTLPFGREL
jgi:nucleoside phosphorylase